MSSGLYSSYFSKKYNKDNNTFFIKANDIIENIQEEIKKYYYTNNKIIQLIQFRTTKKENKENKLLYYIIKCIILILFDNKQYIKGLNLLKYYYKNIDYDEDFEDIIDNYEDLNNIKEIYKNDNILYCLSCFINTINKKNIFDYHNSNIMTHLINIINDKRFINNHNLLIDQLNNISIFERGEVLDLLTLYYFYSSNIYKSYYKHYKFLLNIDKKYGYYNEIIKQLILY